MKYDILLDELIWLQPNGFTKVKLEKHFISFFRFKGPNGNIISFKRIRVKLPDVGDSTDIFAEVLVQKKASLFAFRTARIEDNLQMVNGVQCQVKSIIPDNKYFVFLPSRQIIVLRKTSKHAVLKGMPENYRSIIKDIIKANNLSLKSENDLVRLVGLIEG